MSKQPDLSAFPIPRKGGAKPMSEEMPVASGGSEEGEGEGVRASSGSPAPSRAVPLVEATPTYPHEASNLGRPTRDELPSGGTASSGQVVATTVKLDESRYLRLAEAGKPGPGRMRRRTIQDMVIEALDEWFERRGL